MEYLGDDIFKVYLESGESLELSNIDIVSIMKGNLDDIEIDITDLEIDAYSVGGELLEFVPERLHEEFLEELSRYKDRVLEELEPKVNKLIKEYIDEL